MAEPPVETDSKTAQQEEPTADESWELQKQRLMAQYGEVYEPQIETESPVAQCPAGESEPEPAEKLTDWLSLGKDKPNPDAGAESDQEAEHEASTADQTTADTMESADPPTRAEIDPTLDEELRRAEVELSIERARIARQRKQLEDKILMMKMKGQQSKKAGLFGRLSRFLNGNAELNMQDSELMSLEELANQANLPPAEENSEYLDPRDAIYYATPDDLRQAGEKLLESLPNDSQPTVGEEKAETVEAHFNEADSCASDLGAGCGASYDPTTAAIADNDSIEGSLLADANRETCEPQAEDFETSNTDPSNAVAGESAREPENNAVTDNARMDEDADATDKRGRGRRKKRRRRR